MQHYTLYARFGQEWVAVAQFEAVDIETAFEALPNVVPREARGHALAIGPAEGPGTANVQTRALHDSVP